MVTELQGCQARFKMCVKPLDIFSEGLWRFNVYEHHTTGYLARRPQEHSQLFVKTDTVFQKRVWPISSQTRQFEPKHDLLLTLSKQILCLNLARPYARCCLNIKQKIGSKERYSCNIKTCKVSTHPWLAETYTADTNSGRVGIQTCIYSAYKRKRRRYRPVVLNNSMLCH